VWGNGGITPRIHNFSIGFPGSLGILYVTNFFRWDAGHSGQLRVSDGVPRDRAHGVHWMEGGRVDLRAGVNDVGKGRACTSTSNQTVIIQRVLWSL
jgi:hypothetical protein